MCPSTRHGASSGTRPSLRSVHATHDDLQHGIFTSGGGGVIEAAIVAVTLVFSLTVLRFAWTRRDALLAGYSF